MATFNDLSFKDSVQLFLEQAEWLTQKDQPAVTSLERLAEALDARLTASLMAEFTKTYRLLINSKPDKDENTDSLDDFLAGLGR